MKLSKALLAAAIAAPVLSVASHSLLAQDANSQDSGTMERADADMREVLVQLDKLAPKPLGTVPPEEARKQPTPADAVAALLKSQGKDP